MPSSTVENYIKVIYLEQQQVPDELVAMGRLASAMRVAPGTATAMIKTLSDAALVHYEPRTGVRLTPGGQQLALHVLRRHRLVELFLVKILGLDWAQVHEEAEALEHVISDRVLGRMDEVLGHPCVDPHGDPIPTPQGHVANRALKNLTECEPGQRIRVAQIVDQDAAFLQFIDGHGLVPGEVADVVSHDPLADAIQLRLGNKDPITLGHAAAAKILIQSEPVTVTP